MHELKKRSLFVKKLVSQNAPRYKKGRTFFSTRKEKEQKTKEKKDFCWRLLQKTKKEKRERDEEEARDASSSSSAGELFFTENDEKHEFQDEH